jgi:Txe/YoeB family toxin of Txe-Axe toxin-antitoxin module
MMKQSAIALGTESGRGILSLTVKWTPRFQEHYRRYNGINEFVVKKTAELVKKAISDPEKWHFDLEKLKDSSFVGVSAFRFKVTSGDRLIVVVDGLNLILTDIGDHDIMDEYSKMPRTARDEDLRKSAPVGGNFKKLLDLALSIKSDEASTAVNLSNVLNGEVEGEDSRWLYEAELSEEWIHFLDDEQAKIAESLFQKLVVPNEEMSVEFVMGGPGTGKTVVLLNLATNLEQAGRSVSFEASSHVIKYLSSGGRQVPGAQKGFGPGVVALIDDPASSKALADSLRKAKSAGCRAIVIGFDPLQWHERKMEANFRKIFENTKYEFYPLWTCYRQTSGVGKKTLELTEKIYHASSRYLDTLKQKAEREELQPYIDLSLGMSFVDESGRYILYDVNIEHNYRTEIARFRARIDRWKHTPPIAFVYDDALPKEFVKSLKGDAAGLNRTEIPLSRYREIRGVEFQELFLFVTSDFWNDLNKGKMGVGSEDWEKLACLHTILSRPKDSLAIYVI